MYWTRAGLSEQQPEFYRTKIANSDRQYQRCFSLHFVITNRVTRSVYKTARNSSNAKIFHIIKTVFLSNIIYMQYLPVMDGQARDVM